MSLIGINQAFALACQSNVAGTWNAPSTWSNCGGGVPDDLGDTVDIFDSGDVQLNNDFVISFLTVQEGGSLSINAKLTAQPLFVQATSNIFINCNGELVLTEGGSNEGLITNHGILRTITGADFLNPGTYQSSGGDFFVGPFIGNDIEPIPSICVVVGGNLVPIDSTALLLASAQSFSWMIPVILSGIGIGLFVVSRKSENS
jgi:hypothetical protein